MAKPADALLNMSPVGLITQGITGDKMTPFGDVQKSLEVPDIPKPETAAPTPPGVDEADTKARLVAAEQSAKARKKKTGTILTSAQGVLSQAPTDVKQLFGS
jgi:hypothetical protein